MQLKFSMLRQGERYTLNTGSRLGNRDAHIKNWSLIIYRTPKPRLAPAYDLVSTVAWTRHDQTIALNMAGTKRFDAIGLDTFNAFFQRFGLAGLIRGALLTEMRTTTRKVLYFWASTMKITACRRD